MVSLIDLIQNGLVDDEKLMSENVSCDFASFDENNSTVAITIFNVEYYIQTVDGQYRNDLGCKIWKNGHYDESLGNYVTYGILIEMAERFLEIMQ